MTPAKSSPKIIPRKAITPHLPPAPLRRRLLAWYRAHRRSMPWREDPSPYRTLVSEFMLQQTQVATVIPYFERFILRFSGFAALADAGEDEVLAAWSGLGYYRRARFLKRAAKAVMRDHAGRLPTDAVGLRALPGFGEYTTAAVGSIALGLPLACVDGNVRRVIARLMRLRDPKPGEVREAAARLLDPASPGDWNQAMMELGATLCTPRNPRCPACPVRSFCAAFKSGDPENFPTPKKAEKTRRVDEIAVAAVCGGKVLVLRRADSGAFGGMWELPRLDSRGAKAKDANPKELEPSAVLRALTGLSARKFSEAGSARSVFTHHRITTRVFVTTVRTGGSPPRVRLLPSHTESAWFPFEKLPEIGGSRAQKRLFEMAGRFLGSLCPRDS